MLGRLILVVGTGTGIGKTHLACALLLRAEGRALGLKPVESGAQGELGDDGRALLSASHPMFHVKHPTPPYLFRRPVSPHLAAREEGRGIDLDVIASYVREARERADLVVVETAGGLFTPLAPPVTNLDLARALAPEAIVLVAPDRLGVLHDVGATVHASGASGVGLDAIALMAPETADESTGTNAAELASMSPLPVFRFPRATHRDLSQQPDFLRFYAELCTPTMRPRSISTRTP